MNEKRRHQWHIVLAGGIGALVMLGVWLWVARSPAVECSFKLINPMRCSDELRFANPDYESTRKKILADINGRKNQGVDDIVVYFRDLRNGPAFAIDTQSTFVGASLLKLPILLRYLKDAEATPELLDTTIKVRLDPATTNQSLTDDETLEDGREYTVWQLLEKMIISSDNHSRAALAQYYQTQYPDRNIILDTLYDLGIVDSEYDGEQTYVTLKSTASIFRILYNASYLNTEMSEKALGLLVRSRYTDGLMRDLPESIEVASKFGLYNAEMGKQLHDCGIIYYPNHPYELCIMTKGSDLDVLEDAIADISKTVFDEVDRRFGATK